MGMCFLSDMASYLISNEARHATATSESSSRNHKKKAAGADVTALGVSLFAAKKIKDKTKGFGEFKLAEARAAGSWTILFFYPADFTFV